MLSKLANILSRFFKELTNSTPAYLPNVDIAPKPPPEPPKPPIKWLPSPHFSPRRGKKPQIVVLHHTGSLSAKSAISWFQSPQSQVSAHYVIDRDGSITQMVKEEDKAWHAGDSIWNGRKNVNDISIGIELVGDGKTPFTDAQYSSVSYLCRDILKRYSLGISKSVITSHAAVAQPVGRKIDPSPFDWAKFLSMVDKP